MSKNVPPRPGTRHVEESDRRDFGGYSCGGRSLDGWLMYYWIGYSTTILG